MVISKRREEKRKINLCNLFSLKAYADMATAVADSEGYVKLEHGTRAVWSKEIQFKAMPNLMFLRFADVKTELGVNPGLSIQMLTYDNLKLGGKIKEDDKIVEQGLSQSMKDIKVSEYSNAVKVSNLLLVSSFQDIMTNTTNLLARDYALVVDTELRDTALQGTNVIYGRKGTGEKVTSRAELTDDCVLSVATIKDGIEILATNNTPKYKGMNWICFVHPHQSRTLRDDPAWINASNYGKPDQLFTGEIGRIDDTIFIETTLMCNGAVSEGDPAYKEELKKGVSENQTNVYQAVIFGESYYGIAYSLPVELRDNGVEDYGRQRGLAWYSIFGTGLLNENRGVVIETA